MTKDAFHFAKGRDGFTPIYVIWIGLVAVLFVAGNDLDRVFNLYLLLVPHIFFIRTDGRIVVACQLDRGLDASSMVASDFCCCRSADRRQLCPVVSRCGSDPGMDSIRVEQIILSGWGSAHSSRERATF